MTPTLAISARSSGFTLLELMVVLAILAMGSVLLIPNIGSMSSRTFNAQVREVQALLNYTRRNAVVSGQSSSAHFHAAADDAAQADFDQARSTLGRDESWRARGIALFYRDSTEQTTQVREGVTVTFFPEGGSTGGALILALADREAIITIDPFSGKVSTDYGDD